MHSVLPKSSNVKPLGIPGHPGAEEVDLRFTGKLISWAGRIVRPFVVDGRNPPKKPGWCGE